ncbi:MAG: hydantoinase/oxoprolinase family protein, partial [Desulfobacterales bacterium]|nr:hydantoinase/oxoprolinase family protein [Desulfobacterales bacterium]
RALKGLMTRAAVDPRDVKKIAVSTTLATNSVVEGKGARVGLFIIGFTRPFDLPVISVKYIQGGHDFVGKEEKTLDVEALLDGVIDFKDQVEAYAVSSAMSIVNPAHELVAAKAIGLTDPKPVFCSHQISDRAGVRERAATAVLNARLMPVMRDFIEGVRQTLKDLALEGDVSIIRGDAAPTSMENAIERAAATVASGPAATAFFGAAFSPGKEALVVDVGGTTTDITMIRGGRPIIDVKGSLIGEWRTHVDAVEMFTTGVGGDSHVAMSREGALHVGPARVAPLAMAHGAPDPGSWLGGGPNSRCMILSPGLPPEILQQNPVLRFIEENGPSTRAMLQKGLNLADIPLADRVEELVHAQMVAEIGFTPTDALHALGLLEIGNRTPAIRGAEV